MASAKSNELVIVPFYEDVIESIQDANGLIWVVIKRICESLGLAFFPQLRKLKECDWAGITIMVTPDPRGRDQETYVIPLDSLPMWMATIHASKVSPGIRPKLKVYQLEAKDTLARRFVPKAALPAPAQPSIAAETDFLLAQLEAIRLIRCHQLEQEHRLAIVEARSASAFELATDAMAKATLALPAPNPHPGFSRILHYNQRYEISMNDAGRRKLGKHLTRICEADGLEIRKVLVPGSRSQFVNAYPDALLDQWRRMLPRPRKLSNRTRAPKPWWPV